MNGSKAMAPAGLADGLGDAEALGADDGGTVVWPPVRVGAGVDPGDDAVAVGLVVGGLVGVGVGWLGAPQANSAAATKVTPKARSIRGW